ncbi:unnamed protein product [Blepharisma stoltei]|uniref:Uncharacterized protein n=1 Tax=Blepharisma stoltei TaxID=1481888 RepID=A0AAU9JF30_9CILI|nr:unnamed protein product [Blepharisma stoltei]
MIIVQGTLATLQLLKLGIWSCLLIGTITFGCTCDGILPSFILSIIPLIIAFIMIPILIHVFLDFLSRGQDLFAKPILLFWNYAISLSVIIFSALGCLFLDGIIKISLTIIFSPLWFALASLFLFSVFIAEVLIENGYKRAALMLFIWPIAGYIFSFLWMGYIIDTNPEAFLFAIAPIFIANIIHIILYVKDIIETKSTTGAFNINAQELLCILMLPCFVALLTAKIYSATWIPSLTLTGHVAIVLIFCFYKDIQSFSARKDDKNAYETIY